MTFIPALDVAGHTEPHQPPTLAQSSVRTPELPCSADGVEHGIHPITGEAADALDEVLSVVVNRSGPESGNEFVVLLGRSSVHLQPNQPAELQQSGPYASGRTVNQDALTSLHAGGSVHREVPGEVVRDQADRLGGIQARGDGYPTRWRAGR